ncbi:MAG: DUF456 domain-containing protein [Chloroflexota bacterium]|nr:MAG: DUF456 domain-containing protein [Chloroflexota bacterium]
MEPWLDVSIFGVTMFVMLVGLLGLVIPIFPGIVVIWLAALGYGIAAGFDTLGIIVFVLLTLLMLFGTIVDNIMMGLGARKGGASWWSIGIGMAAGIAGTLIWPPVGGLIAAPLSVLLVEYIRVGDWPKVWTSVRGLVTGWGLSVAVKFVVGVVMVGLWLVWALFRNPG